MNKKDRKEEKNKREKRTSIVEWVSGNLKKDIAKGDWKAGDKLPSEGELADMFGVNRLSVRMALQKLQTLGLIETRVGEGSFVKNFSLKPFFNEVAVMYDHGQRYEEVRRLRYLLESECLSLASQNAAPEEKEELRKRLEEHQEKLNAYYQDVEDPELLREVVDADFAFHYEIVKMSHNTLYLDIYTMVQTLVREHATKLIYLRSHSGGSADSPEAYAQMHRKMCDAILRGDVEAAAELSKQMLGIIPAAGENAFP